eukprot:2093302-Amphidinium_carterae.1
MANIEAPAAQPNAPQTELQQQHQRMQHRVLFPISLPGRAPHPLIQHFNYCRGCSCIDTSAAPRKAK